MRRQKFFPGKLKMNVAFHFNLLTAEKCCGTPIPGRSIAGKMLRSLSRNHHWHGHLPVDLYIESLLLHFRAFRRVNATDESDLTLKFDPVYFDRLREDWLAPLDHNWFHFGDHGSLEASILQDLFVVLVTNIDQVTIDQIISDVSPLRYYHSTFQIDVNHQLHRDLYLRSLLPRFSLINESEAAILIEGGTTEWQRVTDECLLRQNGFCHIHYDAYLPWDFNYRERTTI